MSDSNIVNPLVEAVDTSLVKSFGLRNAGVNPVASIRPANTNSIIRPSEKKFSSSPRGANGNQKRTSRDGRRQRDDSNSDLDSQVILVRRVTRVVKGGKRMRFSALVVVGDKAGRVGFGLKKGLDFQDAVAKATKKANDTLIKISIDDQGSISFPIKQKFKSAQVMLKPAKTGTGLIAGGFIRPVLELAGVKNIYSKIISSRNKVVGVQAVFEALKNYKSA